MTDSATSAGTGTAQGTFRHAADGVGTRPSQQTGVETDTAAQPRDPESPQARTSPGLEEVADLLRQTDFDGAMRDVTRFARENPALFLGGAALLGFAATRFLKARARPQEATAAEDDDPWTGHLGSYAGARGSIPNDPVGS